MLAVCDSSRLYAIAQVSHPNLPINGKRHIGPHPAFASRIERAIRARSSSLRKAAVILSSIPDEAAARLLLRARPAPSPNRVRRNRHMNDRRRASKPPSPNEFSSAVSLPQNVPVSAIRSARKHPPSNWRCPVRILARNRRHSVSARCSPTNSRKPLPSLFAFCLAVSSRRTNRRPAGRSTGGCPSPHGEHRTNQSGNHSRSRKRHHRHRHSRYPTEIDAFRRITQIFSLPQSSRRQSSSSIVCARRPRTGRSA